MNASSGKASIHSLLCAALLFSAELLAIECAIQELPGRVPESSLLSDEFDDYTHVAATSLRLHDAPPGAVRYVFVLGGSTMREAFGRSEEELSARLTAELGSKIEFVNLASSSQSQLETAAILTHLPLSKGSVLLIGESPARLSSTAERAAVPLRLGEPFERFSTAEQRWYRSTSLWFYRDWLGRWFERRWPERLLDQITYRSHQYPPGIRDADTIDGATARLWLNVNRDFTEGYKMGSAVLDAVLEYAQGLDVQPVLVEQPVSSHLKSILAPIAALYEAEISRLSTRHHVPYWNYRQELSFSSSDFANHSHLNEAGKRIFEGWLLRRTVNAMTGMSTAGSLARIP